MLTAFDLLRMMRLFLFWLRELNTKVEKFPEENLYLLVLPLTKMLLNAFYTQIVVVKKNLCFHEGDGCFGVTLQTTGQDSDNRNLCQSRAPQFLFMYPVSTKCRVIPHYVLSMPFKLCFI